MPRNVFEEMDARAARAVGRLLEEPCTWRPMQVREYGGEITRAAQPGIDSSRPVIPDISAISTWKPGTTDAAPGAGGASIAGGQLVVDIERSQFPGAPPRRGDRFELPMQDPGERMVEIVKMVNDGSARILFICQVVKP